MQKSPYWKSQQLDRKLRFCLGGSYDGSVDQDGRVRGYGEEAMQNCPQATLPGPRQLRRPEVGDGRRVGAAVSTITACRRRCWAFLTGPGAQSDQDGARPARRWPSRITPTTSRPTRAGRAAMRCPAATRRSRSWPTSGTASRWPWPWRRLDAWMRSYAVRLDAPVLPGLRPGPVLEQPHAARGTGSGPAPAGRPSPCGTAGPPAT